MSGDMCVAIIPVFLFQTFSDRLLYEKIFDVANRWHINIQDLIDSVPVPKPNLADKLDGVQKHNILCILDIDVTRNGIIEIPGFKSNELKSMLDSVSTN